MELHQLEGLKQQLTSGSRPYIEFLRKDTLSCGLYRIAAGGVDYQQPHMEDEVYVVLEGKAKLEVREESQQVTVGSIVFVAANVQHRFLEIEEDLLTLVLFAPPESTLPAARNV